MTCFEPNRRESTPAAAGGGFDRGLEMGMKLGREAERRFQAGSWPPAPTYGRATRWPRPARLHVLAE